MPSKRRTPHSRQVQGRLDEEAISILKALASSDKSVGCAKIAEGAGLSMRKVTGKLRRLLDKGLVERPEKKVYRITEGGGRPYPDPSPPKKGGLRLDIVQPIFSNRSLEAPHIGHTQSSGRSSNLVPGGMS